MSRHRNVRTMNYDEDYEGYDDVYGHSVEDDYCVSPSASQYMFDRSKTQQMSSFFSPEEDDIAEEPEEDGGDGPGKAIEKTRQRLDSLTLESAISKLVPEEEILLKSCLDEIFDVVGDSIPESVIIANIIKYNFKVEKALDNCLKGGCNESVLDKPKPQKVRKDRDAEAELPMDITKVDPVPKVKLIAEDASRGINITGPSPVKPGPLKVRPSSNVTVGFDLPTNRERPVTPTQLLGPEAKNNSKASSPVLQPSTPSASDESSKSSKAKEFKPENAIREYTKERGGGKELLNLLVIGHVDAGKSTLMGHLLYQLGQVPKKSMHKFEQESKKMGKQSFMYAWILDETGEERSRGITMDVGQSKFETDTKSVVLLDAPGHKDFIPNMITGASQADVAILVVDSTTGEFETGFESGGQTREHALLVRSLGVNQLTIAVNKLDTVGWSESRFEDVRVKLSNFLLKNAGFRETDLTFVPCSGLMGDNLTKPSKETQLTSWYKGPTLLQAIDSFRSPDRPVGKPLRITINDVFKGPGGLCVGGRVETGMVQAGDKVVIQPIGEVVIIKNITLEEQQGTTAFAGDPILVTLQGVSDHNAISIGFVLSDPNYPARAATRFRARVVTFEAMTIPLTRGFTGVMHLGSMSEQVNVKKLISQLNKGTGEVVKLKPRCLIRNSNGIIELETTKPICIEEFKDVKELGRFTLRVSGVTIAAGVITQII